MNQIESRLHVTSGTNVLIASLDLADRGYKTKNALKKSMGKDSSLVARMILANLDLHVSYLF
jgi:hypothetical protein